MYLFFKPGMTHSASTPFVFIWSTWQAWCIPPATAFHHQRTSAQSPKASLFASLALTWCVLRHDVETKQQVSLVKHSYISDSCQLLFKHNFKRFHSWATRTTCNFQSFSLGTHDVRHSLYHLKFSVLLILCRVYFLLHLQNYRKSQPFWAFANFSFNCSVCCLGPQATEKNPARVTFELKQK